MRTMPVSSSHSQPAGVSGDRRDELGVVLANDLDQLGERGKELDLGVGLVKAGRAAYAAASFLRATERLTATSLLEGSAAFACSKSSTAAA